MKDSLGVDDRSDELSKDYEGLLPLDHELNLCVRLDYVQVCACACVCVC
jgi:hypothetical protein